jgi:hypothetical protein
MESQTNSLPKANSVVILKNLDEITAHFQEVQSSANKTNASMLYVSCQNFATQPVDIATRELIKNIFEQLAYRTRAGCFNLPAWFKYRESNKKFSNVLKLMSDLSASELQGFISHQQASIKEQLSNLIELEKREFAILVITDFQNIPIDQQPKIAGMIHKLIKGTPMYFKILTVGDPILFRKESTGEIGIQRNHDYIEIRAN